MDFIDAVATALTVMALSVTMGAVFTYVVKVMVDLFTPKEGDNGKD
ncbi:hypothetical protein [Escherichia coli]|nr:hypothetical protein [Escherichia coli]